MTPSILIQSSKFIKPAVPTPPTLHHYKIGFTDEKAPAHNINVVLFFSANCNHNPNFVSQLEKSLEKTLSRFYPLAGRYLEEIHVIDCKDQGVMFINSKINIKLDEILCSNVNKRLVDELFPSAIGAVDLVTDPIVAIQLTTFECGGVALGVSISHRIADASTLCTFVNEWAAISRGENQIEFNGPAFNSSSFFPARGLPPVYQGLPRSKSDDSLRKHVTKRLSFSDAEISNLKEKIVLNDTKQFSKVQLVSALIWKAFIDIDQQAHDNIPKHHIFISPINLRGINTSLIPKDSCGNLCAFLAAECNATIKTTEALGDVLRDSVKNFRNEFLKVCHDNEKMHTMIMNSLSCISTIPPTANVISISSWCKFPFYGADFGFGKPVWVSAGSSLGNKTSYLMDGVGGNGIEAYIGIEDKDVPYFEEALGIKAFAS